ncbi:hypothetical protein [Streptococcus suis]
MKQLEDRESLVEARGSTLNEKADNLSIREKKLVEAENELSRGISKNKVKEQELDECEQVLDKRENSWNDDLSRLQQAQMRLIQENQAIYNVLEHVSKKGLKAPFRNLLCRFLLILIHIEITRF